MLISVLKKDLFAFSKVKEVICYYQDIIIAHKSNKGIEYIEYDSNSIFIEKLCSILHKYRDSFYSEILKKKIAILQDLLASTSIANLLYASFSYEKTYIKENSLVDVLDAILRYFKF